MKKALFFIFLLAGFAAFAQTAQSVTIDYNKTNVPGVSIVIAGYDADFVQNALTYRLEKVANLKGTNSKGFRLYEAQSFPDFGNIKYSIYTRIDKGTKKDAGVTLNLMVSTGNDNFVSPAEDPDLTQKMKDFVTDFNDYMKEYDRAVKMDNLNTLINKLEKEHASLTSDTEKLKKEINDRQVKLTEKEKELTKTDGELQKAKKELEQLKP